MEAGNISIALTDQPLDLSAIWELLADVDSGAHNVFVGRTRRITGDRETEYLVYESHQEMAEKQLQDLASDALAQWNLRRVVVVHRLGRVNLGEASVAIGVAAAHRESVFAATSFIIERLKQVVPIWKQEHWASGESEWMHQ